MTIEVKHAKRGAPVKHQWLRDLELGETYVFGDDLKVSSMRALVNMYALDNNKKFSISGVYRTVTRIA